MHFVKHVLPKSDLDVSETRRLRTDTLISSLLSSTSQVSFAVIVQTQTSKKFSTSPHISRIQILAYYVDSSWQVDSLGEMFRAIPTAPLQKYQAAKMPKLQKCKYAKMQKFMEHTAEGIR